MEIRWKKNQQIPANALEDATETIVRERQHGNLMDQIISEHEKQGGFENLEGKGKPLNLDGEVHENYYLSRIMKNANVLPLWLELQHEIRDTLQSLVHRVDQRAVTDMETEIKKINEKIKQYNRACPSPLLHKPLATKDNFRAQTSRWE